MTLHSRLNCHATFKEKNHASQHTTLYYSAKYITTHIAEHFLMSFNVKTLNFLLIAILIQRK